MAALLFLFVVLVVIQVALAVCMLVVWIWRSIKGNWPPSLGASDWNTIVNGSVIYGVGVAIAAIYYALNQFGLFGEYLFIVIVVQVLFLGLGGWMLLVGSNECRDHFQGCRFIRGTASFTELSLVLLFFSIAAGDPRIFMAGLCLVMVMMDLLYGGVIWYAFWEGKQTMRSFAQRSR